MYKINLVKLPKKVLREKSKEVKIPLSAEDIELAEKMIWHIDDSQQEGSKFQPGVGVAAVQYGILKRMFYINASMVDPANSHNVIELKDVLINPVVVAKSEFEVALNEGEGCLSVSYTWPNQDGYVYRKNRIVIDAYSYNEKKIKRYDLTGYLAIVAQHELDHLEGKLFVDRIQHKQPWNKKQNSRLINQGDM